MIFSNIASKISKVGLTPEMEGEYGSDHAQIVNILLDILHCKYAIDMAYRSFADRVHGPWRDALVDHWYDHAKEERKAQYDIAMKIEGLGAAAIVSSIQIPQCGSDVLEFSKCLVAMELELIAKQRVLLEQSGDNTSMKVFAENLILVDTQHLDDLRRMFKQVG
jgi:bacterioferritin (cytochrome b1)